jgi:hypothetical protein
MGKLVGKIFKRIKDKRNRSTRPGGPDDLSSAGVTGIGTGDEGTNTQREVVKRRPGRRNADTPLGPRGRGRL